MGKPITHISVLITEDCNFNCDYCFYKKNPKKIDWKTMKQIIDWHSESNQKDANLHLQFFGGEPMLEWELIKQAIEYSKTKPQNYIFGITTNGSLLYPERIDYFAEEKVEVLFSVDGYPDVHNIHRKLRNGKGSWSQIEKPMQLCVEKGLSPVARLTYTPETLSYLYDSIVYLLDEIGFENIAPTPAVDSYNHFSKKDMEEWDRQYEKINQRFKNKVLGGKNPGMSYNEKCFRQLLRDVKMESPCGAGKSYAGINYKGEIFPCHRFVQWPEWKIGDVWNGITKPEVRALTKDYNVNLASPKCAGCENKFCGGTCLAANYEENKSLWIPTADGCAISKKQWDNAVQLYNELSQEPMFQKAYANLISRHDINGNYQKKPSKKDKAKEYVNLQLINKKLDSLSQVTNSIAKIMLDLIEKEE